MGLDRGDIASPTDLFDEDDIGIADTARPSIGRLGVSSD